MLLASDPRWKTLVLADRRLIKSLLILPPTFSRIHILNTLLYYPVWTPNAFQARLTFFRIRTLEQFKCHPPSIVVDLLDGQRFLDKLNLQLDILRVFMSSNQILDWALSDITTKVVIELFEARSTRS